MRLHVKLGEQVQTVTCRAGLRNIARRLEQSGVPPVVAVQVAQALSSGLSGYHTTLRDGRALHVEEGS